MDDAIEIFEKQFHELIIGNAGLDVLYDQCLWAEGPVWFGDGGFLLWSDIPNNRMLRHVPGLGTSEFRAPSDYVNGNTRDREGRLISCSHGRRAVLRTEWDGTITVLADSYDGKRLNSPNDVVVKSDGSIWFTDPPYGILSDYEGHKADQEQAGCYVYRLDPDSGALAIVADDFAKPNGLAFSPDESVLYISDTGRSHDPDWPAHIRKFTVEGDRLTKPEIFVDVDSGLSDGFRLDTEGNIWTSAGPGVNVYNPAGALLGRIRTGVPTANLTFGGPKKNRLFITASQYLMAIHVNARGIQSPDPARFIRKHLRLENAPGLRGIKLYSAHKGSRLSLLGGDAPPYWAYAWAGGLALAHYFIAHPNIVSGKRLLDLGAGSGLVGIVAAKLGAKVSASEIDAYGRAAIGLNAQANGVEITLLEAITAPPKRIDIIAAGDVFYDETVAARMLPFLQACAGAGIAVLVGDPGRRDLPLAELEPIASYAVGDMGASGAGEAWVYRLK